MSLSAQCYMLGKLSLGLTAEQQALGLAAAEAAGYTPEEVASVFTPTWSFQIRYRKEYIEPSDGSIDFSQLTNYFVSSGSVNIAHRDEAISALNTTGGVQIAATYLASTPVLTARGPSAMNEFMAMYNSYVHKSDQGATRLAQRLRSTAGLGSVRVYEVGSDGATFHCPASFAWQPWTGSCFSSSLDEYAAPIDNAYVDQPSGYAAMWAVNASRGTIFQYNACSLTAQEILTQCSGSFHPHYSSVDHVEAIPVANHDLTIEEQSMITNTTRVVFGIQFWDFLHIDGNGRQVPAFVCPTMPDLNGDDDPPGESFGFADPADELVCEYAGYDTTPVRPFKPHPRDPNPGIGGGSGGGGGGGFFLRRGDQGPIYPLFKGLLAYDTALKKWGKAKLDYYCLLDLSPINTLQGRLVDVQRFGIEAAAYAPDGFMYRFDEYPVESKIKYGKIGMNRLGFTNLEEVRITFRKPVTGTITVASSLDGRNPEAGLVKIESYEDATWCNMGVGASGKWHTITISGNYDITHMEYIGIQQGSRR